MMWSFVVLKCTTMFSFYFVEVEPISAKANTNCLHDTPLIFANTHP